MTSETTPDIAPRIVDGEPYCTGTECPAWKVQTLEVPNTLGVKWTETRGHCSKGGTFPQAVCIPGLRRQRDALQAERDAAFTAGAGEMARLVHDEMERCIGKARKAKEITRTARLRCEMGAVVGWIATLQEEMFINPETRLRASLPAQIVDEET